MATKRFCDKCGREMMNVTTGFRFEVAIGPTARVRLYLRPEDEGDVCPRCISDAMLAFVDVNYPPLTKTPAKGLPPAKRRRGPLSS
jgi:hypothetical protein